MLQIFLTAEFQKPYFLECGNLQDWKMTDNIAGMEIEFTAPVDTGRRFMYQLAPKKLIVYF